MDPRVSFFLFSLRFFRFVPALKTIDDDDDDDDTVGSMDAIKGYGTYKGPAAAMPLSLTHVDLRDLFHQQSSLPKNQCAKNDWET